MIIMLLSSACRLLEISIMCMTNKKLFQMDKDE